MDAPHFGKSGFCVAPKAFNPINVSPSFCKNASRSRHKRQPRIWPVEWGFGAVRHNLHVDIFAALNDPKMPYGLVGGGNGLFRCGYLLRRSLIFALLHAASVVATGHSLRFCTGRV
jgi:hypothetical protein